MKRFLRIALKTVIVLVVVSILFALFVYNHGIQYSLAIMTLSLRNPYFDGDQYAPERNCNGAAPCSSDEVRVLTYNVLCRICDKEEYDPWDVRIAYLRDLVERYDPDLIGSQELGGWKDMEEFLPEEDIYGMVTFEFGPWTYGDSALFYRKSRYEVLDSGQFWLSPKPNLPFGFSWINLSAPRYLTWAMMRDLHNGFTFLFMNSHVDNNTLNKENSAPLIFKTFSPHAERMPVIFTGDFNTNPTTDRYHVFKKGHTDAVVFHNTADLVDFREIQVYSPETAGPVGTAEFDRFEHMIDHIFLAGPVEKEVLQWVADWNTYGDLQRNASDHPALFAVVRMTLLP